MVVVGRQISVFYAETRNPKFIKLGLLLAILVSFGAASFADVFFPRKDFAANVVAVSDKGIVSFQKQGNFRLWGLQVDPDNLRKHLKQRRLACYLAGESKMQFNHLPIEVKIAHCTYAVSQEQSNTVLNLAQALLKSGIATEICSETNNAFGTCPK